MSHSYTVQTLGPWHITPSTVWCNHCRIYWPLNTFLSIKWSLFSAYFWFQTAVTNGSSEVLPAGVIYKVSPSLVLFLEDHRDSYWKGVVCTPSSRFMEEENSSTPVFFNILPTMDLGCCGQYILNQVAISLCVMSTTTKNSGQSHTWLCCHRWRRAGDESRRCCAGPGLGESWWAGQ